MPNILDQKIEATDYVGKDISGLPDKPSVAGMSAEALKNRFDALTKEVVTDKFNGFIDILLGAFGAANIGATVIAGLAGYTVQEILQAMKELVDTKKSIEQSDKELALKFDKVEAQALVKDISFVENTGIFTITKYDGTKVTIDTAVEKIALDVRLDGQQFVLTLIDGTEQRVDLSAFITQYETKNSATIRLTQENGVLVANVVAGSIARQHLDSDVTAFLETKEANAAQSEANAKVSEQNAKSSELKAKVYEEQALACKEDACACATNASNSERNALASQQTASASEVNAAKSETNAKASETNAKLSELSALNSKTEAKRSELNASASESNAKLYEESAKDSADRAKENADTIDTELIDAKIAAKADNLFFDTETNLLYLMSNGEIIGDGIQVATGTGGGGGGGTTSVIKLTNENGTATITTASGNKVELKFGFSSTDDGIPTGDGSCQIIVDGVVRKTMNIKQGSTTVDVTEYLKAGSNTVRVKCTDIYGNYKLLAYTVSVIDLSITSTFDDSTAYDGEVQFKYTPYGAVSKTIYFILDGVEHKTVKTSSSGKQFTEVLPDMAHGVHHLEVYAKAIVEEETVDSNRLEYDIVCVDAGATTPMIASVYTAESVAQGEQVSIPYIVYDPAKLATDITLTVYVVGEDGVASIYDESEITVDRSRQYWNTRNYPMGTVYFEIGYAYTDASGEQKQIVKTHELTVTESEIDIEAVTNDLELHLTSAGRSNGEANPAQWTYGDYSTEFNDFNWISNGWMRDDKGDSVLRLTGDATAEISLMPFNTDLRVYGKTIELEFAIRDVNNRDAIVIDCMSGDIGFRATADRATLKSEQTTVFCNYRDEERIRLAFVIESRNEYRLMYVYLNGVLSGVKQYPAGDNFEQSTPVKIKIGSPYCAVDLYNVRSYNTALTFTEVTGNFIYDMSDMERKYELYDANDIYDEYNQLSYDELRKRISVMTILGDLPQSKGDKKAVYVSYECLFDSDLSFSDALAEIDVQGTSSQWYVRKNYKLEFPNKIQHHKSQIASKVFTMKADYAEATSTHNTQNANFVETLYSEKTPAQLANDRCRTTIYGYPVVIFHQRTAAEIPQFIGKYNFNFDKGSEEAFGFDLGYVAESWEFKNNTSGACNFLTPIPDKWDEDFEARYPDKNTNISNFKVMHDWVVSTIGDVDKFKAEFEQYFDLHFCLIYYVYTFVALMVDQRAKNMFMTYWAETGKWQPWFYDNDTSFGINNEGELVFDYYHEDIDIVNNETVYNGQNSTLWSNFRQAFPDEIKETYQELRNDGLITYDKFVEYFITNGSDQWSESVYNEDAEYKYISMLKESNDASNLYQARGTGEEHFKYFIENRLNYCDSKWYASDYANDYIALRVYTPATWAGVEPNPNITVTPFSNMYAGARYKANGTLLQERATKNVPVTFVPPSGTDLSYSEDFSDTESAIYGASQLSSIGDLAPLYCGTLNVSKATKLVELKIGDGTAGYRNDHLHSLSVGTNKLLKKIDVQNCPKLTDPLELSGCPNIEEIYAKGSGISSVSLGDSGFVRKMQLPSTIASLTLKNQLYIEELTLEGYSNVKTLWIENCPSVEPMELLDSCVNVERVRFTNVDWEFDDASFLIELSERGLKGIDENGINTDKMWIDGKCHIGALTGGEMAQIKELYPYLTITYTSLASQLIFMNAAGTAELARQTVVNGGNGTDPVRAGTISTPTKAPTAQYTYTYAGWSLTPNGHASPNALNNVSADRYVYAAFTAEIRTYTVYFYNDSVLLYQVDNVPYGGSATYTGGTPVKAGVEKPEDYLFDGWEPAPTNIVGTTQCKAKYKYTGQYAPMMIDRSISGNYTNNRVTIVGEKAFASCVGLTSVSLGSATRIEDYAFSGCTNLKKVDLGAAIYLGVGAFNTCYGLDTVILRNTTQVCDSGVKYGALNHYIYVPKAMVDSYKAHSKWSGASDSIRAIEDYPEITGGVV